LSVEELVNYLLLIRPSLYVHQLGFLCDYQLYAICSHLTVEYGLSNIKNSSIGRQWHHIFFLPNC